MALPGFLVQVQPTATRPRVRRGNVDLDEGRRHTRGGDVVPARIVCGTPALGATCTGLQFPEWMFPCFGNESCGLFFATLKLPGCATCRVV